MPLGGTSNHFRTRALKNVGGWDPYNVTEDADLGIRIYREGFYTSTINSPTYEEAPPRLGVWIGQRTRWVKGWMQTLLVHSRNPVLFVKEMSTRKTIAYHLILTSVVMSILLHPVLLALFIWKFSELSGGLFATSDAILMATSAFNLVGGYSTYGLLAYIVLKSMRQIKLMPFILTFPLYWLLISYAGWLAVIQLMIKPHYWEKTPHGLADSNFQITKS